MTTHESELNGLPIILFATPKELNKWLAKKDEKSVGVWMQFAKKDSGIQSVTYAEALDEALCYGWIDGQKKGFDDKTYLLKFTPRKPRSIWSKINCGKVEALIAAGRMQAAGLAAIERAKQNGQWDAAYDSQSKITVPEDLAAALAKNKKAKTFFEKLDSANRYAILFRVHTAKKPETRTKRIEQFIEMLAREEKIHNR